MNLESKKAIVNKSQKDVFEFLTNLKKQPRNEAFFAVSELFFS